MATLNNLRNGLIDKILTIKNQAFLEALDKLIASSSTTFEEVILTQEQKAMLTLSENDIKNGDLISQEEMNNRNLKWLNEV